MTAASPDLTAHVPTENPANDLPQGANAQPAVDSAALAACLADRLPEFGQLDWVPEIGSTNATLLARVRDTDAPALPWLLGTYLQTQGRGRAGRTWQNQPGTCLMMSVALAVDMPSHRLPALSPLAGLAAVQALRPLAGTASDDIKVKWPNDVQFGDKKLGGILVETTRASQGSGHVVVIGMGLNMTHAAHLSQDLSRSIADWSEVLQADHGTHRPQQGSADTGAATRADGPQAWAPIASALARSWHAIVAQCSAHGFAGLRAQYEAVDALLGRQVNVLEQGEILFHGTAWGYDDDGRILVQTATEGIRPVSVGDVSIRPRPRGFA